MGEAGAGFGLGAEGVAGVGLLAGGVEAGVTAEPLWPLGVGRGVGVVVLGVGSAVAAAGTAFASMGGCTTGVRMVGTSSGAVMRLMGG